MLYWIFFIALIIATLVPDIVRNGYFFLSEERLEELLIFILGSLSFLTFIFKEHQLEVERREKEIKSRRLDQTGKDLVESYGYIGEVNRKMDIVLNVALGFSSGANVTKREIKEVFDSVVKAASFIMKADLASLRFIDLENGKVRQNVVINGRNISIKNESLTEMKGDINIKKEDGIFIVSSPNQIHKIKGFLLLKKYDEKEELNAKNIEILKVLIAQALFLYSLVNKNDPSNEVNN